MRRPRDRRLNPRVLPILAVATWSALAASCAPKGARVGLFDASPRGRTEVFARIVSLEDARELGGGELIGYLGHPDPSIRRRAVLAAGRVGDPFAREPAERLLKDGEPLVRRAAAFALGLLGDRSAAPALDQSLRDIDPVVRGRASEALSRLGAKDSGRAIAEAARRAIPGGGPVLTVRGDDPADPDDPWIELRLHLFALARLRATDDAALVLLNDDGGARLDWWASAWTAMRLENERLAPLLEAAARSTDAFSRGVAARGLGALRQTAFAATIVRLTEDEDEGVVIQALRALPLAGGRGALDAALRHVASPLAAVRREALLALAALPRETRSRSRIIEGIGDPNPWIRAAAWQALARIDGADIGIMLATAGADDDWRVRAAIAQAIGESSGDAAAALLRAFLRDPDPRVLPNVLGALARAQRGDAFVALRDHLTHEDMGVRAAAIEALRALPGAKPPAEVWTAAWNASRSDPDVETQVTLVDALAQQTGDPAAEELLRVIAGSSAARVVRQRALGSSGQRATGERDAIAARDAVAAIAAFANPGGERVLSPRAVITTRHGRIEIALDVVDTPLTTASFVRLARSGFFNGLAFHRVVPGFVVQGGDPRGDGYGGPGFTLRCENTDAPYGRGSVGMALAGKDTGGSQFFITTAPQPHLDGAYTLFGRVVAGMDVVDRLEPGDVMERVDVYDGGAPA